MSTKSLRKQYRLQNWMEAIRDQKASGLSIRQWCEEHHVTRYQFYYRQRVVRAAMADAVIGHSSPEDTVSNTLQISPSKSGKKSVIPVQPDFLQVPQDYIPSSGGAVMRVCRGKVVLEVSNDASDRILGLIREVILDAE